MPLAVLQLPVKGVGQQQYCIVDVAVGDLAGWSRRSVSLITRFMTYRLSLICRFITTVKRQIELLSSVLTVGGVAHIQ